MRFFLLLALIVSFSVNAQTARKGQFDELEKNNPALDFIDILTDLEAMTTGAWKLPTGTVAQRPSVSGGGWIRYNTDLSKFEIYDGTEWIDAAGTGGGLDKWEPSTLYEVDRVVWLADDNNIYVCIEEHTSGMTFDPTKWNELSSSSDKLDKFPAETNDNRLVRTDGNGNAVQGSVAILSDAGALSGLTQLDVDNVRVDGNSITATDTNGNLSLSANGSGLLNLEDLSVSSQTITGTVVNGDIVISPNGTGQVDISYLTADRVLFNDAGGVTDSNDLTFNDTTDVLRVSGIDIDGGAQTVTTHSSNQDLNLDAHGTGDVNILAPLNVGGLNIDASTITGTGVDADITITPNGTGEVVASGALNVDNLRLDGNDITSTNTNGNINITPNGLGLVAISTDAEIADLSLSGSEINPLSVNADLTLSPDGTGDILTNLDGRSYNQDPQIQHGNLIPNASFERDDVSFITCTNATASTEASELGGQGNQRQLTIASSGTSWSCDIVGAASEGQGVLTLSARASAASSQACSLVNSTEQECKSIAISADMASYSFIVDFGGTSNSVRLKGATSGDVVKVDLIDMRQRPLASPTEINFVSGGTEVLTGNTWDAAPIYRRCYEVVSDITGTSVSIATIPSGLNPVFRNNYAGSIWNLFFEFISNSEYSQVYYDRSTGSILGFGVGGLKVGAGTRFCMEYLK